MTDYSQNWANCSKLMKRGAQLKKMLVNYNPGTANDNMIKKTRKNIEIIEKELKNENKDIRYYYNCAG